MKISLSIKYNKLYILVRNQLSIGAPLIIQALRLIIAIIAAIENRQGTKRMWIVRISSRISWISELRLEFIVSMLNRG